jgi:hypothetical protein
MADGNLATSTTLYLLNGFYSSASSTLTNFSFAAATGTEATTTSLYVSGLASTTNLRANVGIFGIASSTNFRADNGTGLLPSYSFASQANTGIYRAAVNDVSIASNGARVAAFSGADLYLLGASPTIRLGASSDTIIAYDAADALALRRTTNAQTFRVYNTFTDASNYERAAVKWSSNTLVFGSEILGTGTARNVYLQAAGAAQVRLSTNSNDRWVVDSSGNFITGSTGDNSYDIGASGATRPRTIYVGTDVVVAGTTGGGSATYAQSTGFLGWTSRSRIRSASDGVISLLNNAETDFTRLQFGGTTSSFPAIKRTATALNFRLADDSADAGITAGTILATGSTTLQALTAVSATTTNATTTSLSVANNFLTLGGSSVSYVGSTTARMMPFASTSPMDASGYVLAQATTTYYLGTFPTAVKLVSIVGQASTTASASGGFLCKIGILPSTFSETVLFNQNYAEYSVATNPNIPAHTPIVMEISKASSTPQTGWCQGNFLRTGQGTN